MPKERFLPFFKNPRIENGQKTVKGREIRSFFVVFEALFPFVEDEVVEPLFFKHQLSTNTYFFILSTYGPILFSIFFTTVAT